jgi:hypothetical protein
MQNMGFSPAWIAARIFRFTIRRVSPKRVRRSE